MIEDIRSANIGQPCIEVDDHGDPVGKDPRHTERSELHAAGHEPMPLLKAVRAKCLSCCCGSVYEVRNCIITTCPLWPFRMATNPWRERKTLSPEHRARLAATQFGAVNKTEAALADGSAAWNVPPGGFPKFSAALAETAPAATRS